MAKSYFSFSKSHLFGDIAGRGGSFIVNEKLLLSAGSNSVALWNLRKAEQVAQKIFDDPVTSLALSSSVAVGLRSGKISVLSLEFQENSQFEGHDSSVTALVYSKDSLELVSASFDTTIIVWDLVGECAVKRLQGHRDAVTGLILNDGLIFSSSRDKMIKVWEGNMTIQTLLCPEEIWGLSVASGKIYAVCGKYIKCWNLDYQELGVLERGDHKKGKKIIVKDDLVICLGEKIEAWRIRGSKELEKKVKRRRKRNRDQDLDLQFPDLYEKVLSFKPEHKVSSISVLSEQAKEFEKKIGVFLSLSNNYLEKYSFEFNVKNNLKTPPRFAEVYKIDHEGHRTPARTLSLSQDNSILLSGSGDSVKIWNMSNRKCLVDIETGYCLSSSWFPGDKYAVVGCRDGSLQLLDVLSSSIIDTCQAHEGSIWACHIQNQVLVTGSADCSVKFWTLNLKQIKLQNFDQIRMKDEILALKITSNNKLICAALLDCTIQVLYLDSRKLLFSLYAHKLPVTCFDITSDTLLLVSGSSDKTIKIWGLDFGDVRKSIIAHSQGLTDVKCVNDTHFAFSASRDFSIKYWDLDKHEVIQVLKGHSTEIWSICISNQGDFLVSTSNDFTFILWTQTENQLFLKEQREIEIEETAKLEDLGLSKAKTESSLLTHTSSGVLTSAETLISALELCIQYKQNPEVVPLQFLGKSDNVFLLNTLLNVPSQYLDSVLYVLPYSYAIEIFPYLEFYLNNNQELELICKVLFLLLKVHENALISSTFGNEHWIKALDRVKSALRTATKSYRDTIGRNIAATKYILSL